MSLGKSNLAGMPEDEQDRLAHCVKLLLLWVAASDGNVDISEIEFADSKIPAADGELETSELLEVIRSQDERSLEMAIRFMADRNRELRTAFLDMAITMSIADRELAIAENHILRFYADALYLGEDILQNRARAITGMDLPDPGDPGDPSWWEREGGRVRIGAQASGGTGMTLTQARTMFCVGPEASADEIEQAYDNLRAIFQSQQVEEMGSAALAVANRRLGRIEEAYELLRG